MGVVILGAGVAEGGSGQITRGFASQPEEPEPYVIG